MRQPIVTILAHVDHGKTTLLDYIRRTTVAAKEAGGITQAIGSTVVPKNVIEAVCGPLLKKFNFEVDIPGLLFIDTPGHEAFTTLRRRGGSIADIAVLVVDILEGIMPQTIESLEILKQNKTPFIVAVNKLDRLHGWETIDCSFLGNINLQSPDVVGDFEEKFYNIVGQFAQHGFNVDRFDRVQDFTKTICAVPVSGKTGEGLPELMTILIGLSQKFLKDQLVTSDHSEGMVLEVKEVPGLGTTLDTIVYDGSVKRGDYIILVGNEVKITKIKAMLIPKPMKDIRTEKKFDNIEGCSAACGTKIVALDTENIIPGSIFMTASNEQEAEEIAKKLEKERENIEIVTSETGLTMKADTLGSLEALVNVFKNYTIRLAKIGSVTREDIIVASSNPDSYRVLLCFNVGASDEMKKLAKDHGVYVIESPVIYRIAEEYKKWLDAEDERVKQKIIENLVRPGKITVIPGCVFRASNPAIVGCEITGGVIKPGTRLGKFEDKEFSIVGEVKQVQSDGTNIQCAKCNDKVAISITGVVVGRNVKEGDTLYADVSSEEYKELKKNEKLLSSSERAVLKEFYELRKRTDARYGL